MKAVPRTLRATYQREERVMSNIDAELCKNDSAARA